MSVTYPQDVILAAGTAVDGTGDQQKATVKQGLEYVGNTLSNVAESKVTLNDGQNAEHYELTLPVDESNATILVPVSIKYRKGLTGVAVYHNGNLLETAKSTPAAEYFTYNSDTGVLVLYVFHASPIDIVCDASAAAIGSTVYNTLAEAIAAAEDGDTITLLQDVTISEALSINAGITIEGSGKTITDSAGAMKPAINIYTDKAVNINDLTINGAERAFDLLDPAAKLSLTNCTLNVSKRGITCSLTEYDGMSLTLDGTKVNNTKVSDYNTSVVHDQDARGISLWGTKNTTVTLKNGSELNGFSYCINVSGEQSESGVADTKGLIVTVEDSTPRGWTGFNVWGSEGTYNLTRSTVLGVNVSSGTSDNFAAIVFNDDLYDLFESAHAENNILNITDSTITNYQGGTCVEELLRIDCGITKLNLSGEVNFVDTTGNISSALYLASMSNPMAFLKNSVNTEGATVTCTTKDGAELPFAPSYTAYYYWAQGEGFQGVNCDLKDIFTSSDYTLYSGEYIDLLSDATLDGDVTAALAEGSGSFTLNQGEYTVTGGRILLPAEVSVDHR